MKKVLLLILVLLVFPLVVYAKTPTKDETLKIIDDISNISVDENIKINSTVIDDDYIIFNINEEIIKIPYVFSDNKFSFMGGNFVLDDNKKLLGDIKNNNYAFYLYSILENKSTIPLDINNYYNNTTIKEKINNDFNLIYREPTNTFGITLKENDNNNYTIFYDYYLDGDYPVLELDNVSDDFTNPSTGNYNLLVTVMLISVLCIGIYTYFDPKRGNLYEKK